MFAMFSEDSEQFVGWFLVPFGSFVSPGYQNSLEDGI